MCLVEVDVSGVIFVHTIWEMFLLSWSASSQEGTEGCTNNLIWGIIALGMYRRRRLLGKRFTWRHCVTGSMRHACDICDPTEDIPGGSGAPVWDALHCGTEVPEKDLTEGQAEHRGRCCSAGRTRELPEATLLGGDSLNLGL